MEKIYASTRIAVAYQILCLEKLGLKNPAFFHTGHDSFTPPGIWDETDTVETTQVSLYGKFYIPSSDTEIRVEVALTRTRTLGEDRKQSNTHVVNTIYVNVKLSNGDAYGIQFAPALTGNSEIIDVVMIDNPGNFKF